MLARYLEHVPPNLTLTLSLSPNPELKPKPKPKPNLKLNPNPNQVSRLPDAELLTHSTSPGFEQPPRWKPAAPRQLGLMGPPASGRRQRRIKLRVASKPRPASANQSLRPRWPARFTAAVFPTQAAALRS